MKNKKDNFNQPVTKGEFNLKMTEFTITMAEFGGRMDKFDQRMESLKQYIDRRFDEFEEKVYTKADHAKFMIWMDEAMTELRDAREGRNLYERQMLRLDDSVADHEKRICILEEK